MPASSGTSVGASSYAMRACAPAKPATLWDTFTQIVVAQNTVFCGTLVFQLSCCQAVKPLSPPLAPAKHPSCEPVADPATQVMTFQMLQCHKQLTQPGRTFHRRGPVLPHVFRPSIFRLSSKHLKLWARDSRS